MALKLLAKPSQGTVEGRRSMPLLPKVSEVKSRHPYMYFPSRHTLLMNIRTNKLVTTTTTTNLTISNSL